MTLINKEKFLNGVGKAVDVTNNAADKAENYIKEHEIDVKTKKVASEVGAGAKKIGKKVGNKIADWIDNQF